MPDRSNTDPEAHLADMPVSVWFGLRYGASDDGQRAQVTLPMRRELLQVDGVVHGGILATLADTAAVHLLRPALAADERMTSIEFKLNFVRPAVESKGDLAATAQLVRRGRTILLADVDVEQAGQLVARGTFTYLRLRESRS